MKRVGVREFRDSATRYLAGNEVLAIERHGQPIGFYIPVLAAHREHSPEALARLEATVRQVTAESGLSEAELSGLFDLAKPLPPRSKRSTPADASGR